MIDKPAFISKFMQALKDLFDGGKIRFFEFHTTETGWLDERESFPLVQSLKSALRFSFMKQSIRKMSSPPTMLLDCVYTWKIEGAGSLPCKWSQPKVKVSGTKLSRQVAASLDGDGKTTGGIQGLL